MTNRTIGALGWLALLALAVGCGRSESGGSAAEGDPGGEQLAAASDSGARPLPMDMVNAEELARQHGELYETLAPLRQLTFADEEVQTEWAVLLEDVNAAILENSEFHRKLMARWEEIIARVEKARETHGPLPRSEQAQLAANLQNIQTEMARVRAVELQQPEFFPRLLDFNRLIYDKMRQLEPEREAEVNRLEQLAEQLMMVTPVPQRGRFLALSLPEEGVEPLRLQPGQKPPVP